MRNKDLTLGERELDIMDVLWTRGAATVGEVHRALVERDVDVAYNTVQTMLNRLEAKEIVVRDATDRAHRYRPVVKRRAAVGSAIRRLTRRFFDGSAEALAAQLVESNLDDAELERMRTLIAELQKGKRS
jgi:BlaI family penicillinase repressor